MRFHSFVNEDTNTDQDLEVIEMIRKECQPFLKDWKATGLQHNWSLLRGLKEGKNLYYRKQVRQDRRPKDSDDSDSKVFDEWLFKKFGIHGRTQCIFCTSDGDDAGGYGPIYYVFPIGKYDILWSMKYRDVWGDIFNDPEMDPNLINHPGELNWLDLSFIGKRLNIDIMALSPSEQQKIWVEERDKSMERIMRTYKKGDLKGALQSKNEIMVKCNEYFAVRKVTIHRRGDFLQKLWSIM